MQKKSSMKFNYLIKYFLISTIFILAACNNGSNSSTPTPNNDPTKVPLVTVNDNQLMDSVNNITNFPTQLESQIWSSAKMNPEVKEKALTFANSLFNQLHESNITITDIVTLGSLASYEYDQYADLDIHIFIDTTNYHGDVNVLKKYITQFNYVNINKYHVNYYGYPAEFLIYAATPASQIESGVGMYSLMTDTWLNQPTQNINNYNKEQIFTDAKHFIGEYNQLINRYNSNPQAFDCNQFNTLNTEMRNYRSNGIQQYGIRSTANLTYRMLRRLNINMPDTLRTTTNTCIAIHSSILTNN